jgi:Ca2+:H+ antiporter
MHVSRADVQNTIKGCPILLALPILIPVAWALELTHQGDVAIFVTCLLAIIPLAGGISFA